MEFVQREQATAAEWGELYAQWLWKGIEQIQEKPNKKKRSEKISDRPSSLIKQP